MMMNHPNRSMRHGINEPIRWVEICKAATLLGIMNGVSKQECFRIHEMLKNSGRAQRLSRGVWQLTQAQQKLIDDYIDEAHNKNKKD
jgi:hypothetical protein